MVYFGDVGSLRNVPLTAKSHPNEKVYKIEFKIIISFKKIYSRLPRKDINEVGFESFLIAFKPLVNNASHIKATYYHMKVFI